MTANETKALLPILLAFAERKTIQYKDSGMRQWVDIDPSQSIHFVEPNCYRIKTTLTYRPWKPEEVPVGAVLRHKTVAPLCRRMILQSNDNGIILPYCSTVYKYSFEEILRDYEHSLNQGHTWLPCGVPVEGGE